MNDLDKQILDVTDRIYLNGLTLKGLDMQRRPNKDFYNTVCKQIAKDKALLKELKEKRGY